MSGHQTGGAATCPGRQPNWKMWASVCLRAFKGLLHNRVEARFDLFSCLLSGDQLIPWELHPLVSYTSKSQPDRQDIAKHAFLHSGIGIDPRLHIRGIPDLLSDVVHLRKGEVVEPVDAVQLVTGILFQQLLQPPVQQPPSCS